MRVAWGRIMLCLFVLLLACSSIRQATALGLSYEYMEDKTLELAPGENYYFKLIFQNDEGQDVRIRVALDSEIATLIGDPEVTIPAETYDSFVYFNITVPPDAEPGAEYRVNYEVLPTEEGEGQVPFTVKYSRWFTVRVIDEYAAAERQAPGDVSRVARDGSWLGNTVLTVVLLVLILAVLLLAWRRSELFAKGFRGSPARAKASRPENSRQEPAMMGRETPAAKRPEHLSKGQARSPSLVRAPAPGRALPPEDAAEGTTPQQPAADAMRSEEWTKDPGLVVEKKERWSFLHKLWQHKEPEKKEAASDADVWEDGLPERPGASELPKEQAAWQATGTGSMVQSAPRVQAPPARDEAVASFSLDQLPVNEAPSGKAFFLHDGMQLKNLHSLYRALQAMSDETFAGFVTAEKNDFSTWTGDALGLPDVAARLKASTTKEEMLRALEGR